MFVLRLWPAVATATGTHAQRLVDHRIDGFRAVDDSASRRSDHAAYVSNTGELEASNNGAIAFPIVVPRPVVKTMTVAQPNPGVDS